MKMYAPSLTNCFAVARPMPLLPPVMSAIFPSSLPTSFSLGVIFSLFFASVRASERYGYCIENLVGHGEPFDLDLSDRHVFLPRIEVNEATTTSVICIRTAVGPAAPRWSASRARSAVH